MLNLGKEGEAIPGLRDAKSVAKEKSLLEKSTLEGRCKAFSWAGAKMEAGEKMRVLAKRSARSSVRRHRLRPTLQGGTIPGVNR